MILRRKPCSARLRSASRPGLGLGSLDRDWGRFGLAAAFAADALGAAGLGGTDLGLLWCRAL
jgi:hypothetical protein